MAKTKKFTVDDAAAEVVSAFEKFLQTLAATGGGSKVSATSDDDVEEVEEDDEDEEELEAPDRETVESLGIKELRELAAEYGIDEKKKADILAAFEDLYSEDEEEDEDEDDEEDEEEEAEDEDEDEEESEWDRDSLSELDLKELRKVAKDEGHASSEYKGMDQDDLIDLILGDEDEEEDEDEEDEDEAEELDEDDLMQMSHKDLISLCKELEIKVPAALKKDTKANHKKLVAHVLDDAEE